jgi:hypothetical protein
MWRLRPAGALRAVCTMHAGTCEEDTGRWGKDDSLR